MSATTAYYSHLLLADDPPSGEQENALEGQSFMGHLRW